MNYPSKSSVYSSESNINQFKEYMRQIDLNNHNLQYFTSIFNTKPTVPFGTNKEMLVVKTEVYQRLRTEIEESRIKQQQLSEQIYVLKLENVGLRQQCGISKELIKQMNKNQKMLREKLQESYSRMKQYEQIFKKDQHQNNNPMQDQAILQQQILREKRGLDTFKQFKSIDVQTDYQIDHTEKKNNIIIEQFGHQDTEALNEQHRLYEMLNKNITNFQLQFQKQLNRLQSEKLAMEEWQRQNEELKRQNQELKKQVNQIDLQQQQLKIWTNSVLGFVTKLQGSILQTNSDKIAGEGNREKSQEEINKLSAEIIQLRGRIAELKQRAKWAEQLIQGEQQSEDEGSVGLLVRLSQRVKGIVKNMLMEVQKV